MRTADQEMDDAVRDQPAAGEPFQRGAVTGLLGHAAHRPWMPSQPPASARRSAADRIVPRARSAGTEAHPPLPRIRASCPESRAPRSVAPWRLRSWVKASGRFGNSAAASCTTLSDARSPRRHGHVRASPTGSVGRLNNLGAVPVVGDAQPSPGSGIPWAAMRCTPGEDRLERGGSGRHLDCRPMPTATITSGTPAAHARGRQAGEWGSGTSPVSRVWPPTSSAAGRRR